MKQPKLTSITALLAVSVLTAIASCRESQERAVGQTELPAETPIPILASGATIKRVATGLKLGEGPVWSTNNQLIVSDVISNTVYTLKLNGTLSVLQRPSGWANGHGYDAQKRLIATEHANRRVTRIEPDGTITVLADRYEGKRLNSPNDLIVRSDGSILFTDPPFGLTPPYGPTQQKPELGFSGVYRFDPASGTITLLTRDLLQPNGIALSPDEQTLYVSDTATGQITAFPIQSNGRLRPGRPLGAGIDGLAVDSKGHIWSVVPGGIAVIRTDGTELMHINVPEQPTNLTWGGSEGRTLYITTYSSVYQIETRTTGAYKH